MTKIWRPQKDRKRKTRRKAGTSGSRRRQRKVKKTNRYEVAVEAVSGRTTRIRPALRVRLPTRLFSAILLIAAGWLIFWFSNADIFYIDKIEVRGHWRLPEAELFATSGLEGVNVFWADTQLAVTRLESLPDVLSADVRCSLPANCTVKIAERPASLVWRQGDAEVWIGADGVAVPARGEMPNAIVLDAAGSAALRPGDQIDPALLAAVQELEQLQPEVRVYRYSNRYGLMFDNGYNWPVRLGDGNQVATKLVLSRTISEHLLEQGIVPAYVDVRFPEAPYYDYE